MLRSKKITIGRRSQHYQESHRRLYEELLVTAINTQRHAIPGHMKESPVSNQPVDGFPEYDFFSWNGLHLQGHDFYRWELPGDSSYFLPFAWQLHPNTRKQGKGTATNNWRSPPLGIHETTLHYFTQRCYT